MSAINYPLLTINYLLQDKVIGRVRQVRMNIEEKIRKEKRDKMVEEIRKPLLTTPGGKRGRREDEDREGKERHDGDTPATRPMSPMIKMTQTPIQSFLVAQTLEERKRSFQAMSMKIQKRLEQQHL